MRLLAFAVLALRAFASVTPCAAAETVAVGTAIVAPISPLLYGVNYDWNIVSASEYPGYVAELKEVSGFTMQRFPAGWDAEWYDWNTNTAPQWRKQPEEPGADAQQVVASSPAVTFITPSQDAVRDPTRIPEEVRKATAIVAAHKDATITWEIGNEWWLQSGAKQDSAIRDRNLRNYAALLAAVVPAVLAIEPRADIYAAVDWRQPVEIATMRSIIGSETWSRIKGLSIHIYCGTEIDGPQCTEVPDRLRTVEQASGKSSIYVSEWNVPHKFTRSKLGLAHANEIGIAIGLFARSGVDLAAYWPATRLVNINALITRDLARPEANGVLFGWLADGFRGDMVETTGSLPAIASRNNGVLNVFLFSRDMRRHDVIVDLPRGLTNVSGKVMFSRQPDGSGVPAIAELPFDAVKGAGRTQLRVVLNPGGADRGIGWEIARITAAP